MIEVVDYNDLIEMKMMISSLKRKQDVEYIATPLEDFESLINEVLRLRLFHQKAHDLAIKGLRFLAIEMDHPNIVQIYQLVREGYQKLGVWTAENESDFRIIMSQHQ